MSCWSDVPGMGRHSWATSVRAPSADLRTFSPERVWPRRWPSPPRWSGRCGYAHLCVGRGWSRPRRPAGACRQPGGRRGRRNVSVSPAAGWRTGRRPRSRCRARNIGSGTLRGPAGQKRHPLFASLVVESGSWVSGALTGPAVLLEGFVFLGVEEPAAVGDEIGVVLPQAPAELDDRLAQLDGTLPGDVLAGPGPPGGTGSWWAPNRRSGRRPPRRQNGPGRRSPPPSCATPCSACRPAKTVTHSHNRTGGGGGHRSAQHQADSPTSPAAAQAPEPAIGDREHLPC